MSTSWRLCDQSDHQKEPAMIIPIGHLFKIAPSSDKRKKFSPGSTLCVGFKMVYLLWNKQIWWSPNFKYMIEGQPSCTHGNTCYNISHVPFHTSGGKTSPTLQSSHLSNIHTSSKILGLMLPESFTLKKKLAAMISCVWVDSWRVSIDKIRGLPSVLITSVAHICITDRKAYTKRGMQSTNSSQDQVLFFSVPCKKKATNQEDLFSL